MDLRKIQQAAKAQGWSYEKNRKGHWEFYPPGSDRKAATFSGTPSDQRAIKNGLAALKRANFIWPWPPPGKGRKGRRRVAKGDGEPQGLRRKRRRPG